MKTSQSSTPPLKIDVVIDVKGEMCPVPLMRTMTTMKTLLIGQILAVITDHIPSTLSIPEKMKRRGHQVLRIEELDGHIFRILIRK